MAALNFMCQTSHTCCHAGVHSISSQLASYFLRPNASARKNQLNHNNVWYFNAASCKTVQSLTSERRNHTRGLFHKNFLRGGNMMKCLRRQNITYSLLHQIIKQTEASYRILQGSGGTGNKKEKKCLFYEEEQQFALSSLLLLMWEHPAVTPAASQERGDYKEPENQEKNVMYYRHEGISPLLPNQVLSHSTGCLGSKGRDTNRKGGCAQFEEDCEIHSA